VLGGDEPVASLRVIATQQRVELRKQPKIRRVSRREDVQQVVIDAPVWALLPRRLPSEAGQGGVDHA